MFAPQTDNILTFLQKQSNLQEVSLSPHTILKNLGEDCDSLVVVTSGQVKVFQTSEEGKSLLLYHIQPAQTCVLTISCLMNQRPFPAIAETEVTTQGYVIPLAQFQTWLQQEPIWQNFIFSTLSNRLGDLLNKVEQLAFTNLESRLIEWLSHHPHRPMITATHQQIAEEVGSSREVISRTLKKLSANGLVKLHRGSVEWLSEFE